jgi:leucyl/phenylalanyl-tRNA--protein transferase
MYFLDHKIHFPHVSNATADGLLAIGGDLSVERLIHAYESGIFPWYEAGGPILWWSPDPRFVLFPKDLRISKSMRAVLKKSDFKVTVNKAFREVLTNCSVIKRKDQAGTWITSEMKEAYIKLFEKGFAKSYEVWYNNKLAGGLYGVDLNNGVFCGESMFNKQSNASKVAFITLVQEGGYKLIDCQLHTKHLESLGAKHISREAFIKYLAI